MKTCQQCGTEMPDDAPEGLCPRCLISAAAKPGDVSSEPTRIEPESGAAANAAGASLPQIPDIGDAAEVARRLPQFEILELLGRGGMGVVYKARQLNLDRIVALKILPPADALSPDFVERFRREARSLAKLGHPNIVHVYDFGESGGLYYFVMEFVDGVNLRELIRTGKMKPEEALTVVPKICDALQFAHEEGVVHRDVKPENILIDKRGRVKIADFGLAKLLRREQADHTLTMSGMTLGTPRYMAPEQLDKPETVDHRADIYSLGVVFYEMLTGEVPMGRFAPPSEKVRIDVRLDEIVLHALERDVERRYQHVSQVREDVESIAHKPSSLTPPTPPPEPVSEPRLSRRSLTSTTLGLVGLALLAWAPDIAIVTFACLGSFIAATVLGIAAVSHIHRSGGRIYGLSLALGSSLIFPFYLLVCLVYVVFSGTEFKADFPGVVVAFTAILPLAICFFTARSVWLWVRNSMAAGKPAPGRFRNLPAWSCSQRDKPDKLKNAGGDPAPKAPAPQSPSDAKAAEEDAEEEHSLFTAWGGRIIALAAVLLAFFNPWGAKAWYFFASGCAIFGVLSSFGIGRRKISPAQLSAGEKSEPRLSRPALWGAIWAPFVAAVALPGVVFFDPKQLPHTGLLADLAQQRPAWFIALNVILLIVGGSAPFGTTILGAVALQKIKRSGGRLYGLRLAAADTLFFPFVALLAAIRLMINGTLASLSLADPRVGNPLAAVVCFFIGRAAWRKIVGPPAESKSSADEIKPGAENIASKPQPGFLRLVIVPTLILIALCFGVGVICVATVEKKEEWAVLNMSGNIARILVLAVFALLTLRWASRRGIMSGERARRFLSLRSWTWPLAALVFVPAAIYAPRPGDMPMPKDAAEIFNPITLVTSDGGWYRFLALDEWQKFKPVYTVNWMTTARQEVTRTLGWDPKNGASLGFFQRSATWKYDLTATRFDWKSAADGPLEIARGEIAKLRPLVVAELNRREPGRGKTLEDILDNGRRAESVVCWQNFVVLLAWIAAPLGVLAMLWMFRGAAVAALGILSFLLGIGLGIFSMTTGENLSPVSVMIFQHVSVPAFSLAMLGVLVLVFTPRDGESELPRRAVAAFVPVLLGIGAGALPWFMYPDGVSGWRYDSGTYYSLLFLALGLFLLVAGGIKPESVWHSVVILIAGLIGFALAWHFVAYPNFYLRKGQSWAASMHPVSGAYLAIANGILTAFVGATQLRASLLAKTDAGTREG